MSNKPDPSRNGRMKRDFLVVPLFLNLMTISRGITKFAKFYSGTFCPIRFLLRNFQNFLFYQIEIPISPGCSIKVRAGRDSSQKLNLTFSDSTTNRNWYSFLIHTAQNCTFFLIRQFLHFCYPFYTVKSRFAETRLLQAVGFAPSLARLKGKYHANLMSFQNPKMFVCQQKHKIIV